LSAKKIKGSKKRFETTEEIVGLSQRATDYARENPYMIIAAVAGIFLLLGIIWGVSSYRQANERRARAEYSKIMQGWPANDFAGHKDWDKLVPKLQDFIKQHQGTQPALNAQLDLAQAYFWMKRYDDSAKVANTLLNETSAENPLRPLVRYHLALTYEEMNKIDDAITQWKDLAKAGVKGLERETSWHLARLYADKKEYTKAVEQYENALKSNGGYPSTQQIQQELEMAKLKTAPVSNGSKKGSAQPNSQG